MRDLYVQIPGGYSDNRINASYRFGGAPLLNATIEKNFGVVIDGNVEVGFDQFAKIEVNGTNTDPLFACLRNQTGTIPGDVIKWNFTKFLIDKNGNPVEQFAPACQPKDIEQSIIEELKK